MRAHEDITALTRDLASRGSKNGRGGDRSSELAFKALANEKEQLERQFDKTAQQFSKVKDDYDTLQADYKKLERDNKELRALSAAVAASEERNKMLRQSLAALDAHPPPW